MEGTIGTVEKKNTSMAIGAVVIASIVIILAIFFIVKPLMKSNSEKQKIIEVKKYNLDILQDKERKLKDLSAREQEIKEDAKKVKSALPEYKDKARLFNQFGSLAANSGVVLKSVSSQDISSGQTQQTSTASGTSSSAVNTPSGTTELSCNLEISGKPENLLSFLTNSMKALRIMRVNKLSIRKETNSSDLNISINMSAFYNPGGSEGNNATK